MSAGTEWLQNPTQVTAPRTLEIADPVEALTVRVYGGTVNVVGTSDGGPARVEISELDGPPLTVSCRDGVLSVAYEDLPWRGFLKFLDRRAWNRSAVVSVTVPAGTRVEVGVIRAGAVVSGITGRADVRGVSGDSTLVGLTGTVLAETVSGNVEVQSLTGDLRFHSVSGNLTVIDGAGGGVHADSVSGDMVLDLAPGKGADIALTTVSGEVAIRLPDPADARVEANTTSGTVANAFDDLRVSGQWGTKRITGSLGAGTGTLKATTISGGLALLRRPAPADEDHGRDDTDGGHDSGPHEDSSATTTGKKVR
ncbi:DUF4097 and DUF4098 domain-containing protein YvlB [Streptomyces sp. 2333.5]|uniref:DUF4097 family beta strand repeat-containing protein n=1 Tax=Streptomyces TaxID=1883 RepID=UPI0008994464|nr:MULTISPECIES: DUF4097 family beta strand repeat-containing protein [unclassified Streptomyces]PJJ04430.1 DUF4097 and DUF4098 domain-containing protein YvlB [Streptomyces sp. 2333.5]SEE50922.1 DUF4097 and DUF4098 domain-containing protein YvlB [Streptomyces sp. 2314.4]SEE77645.1 DUF4097 and DUF4098 domain-containing protein YvlB [Streptomyces sp. 2112.2]SOE11216.1 DUF4097 and DUF4098 domain-containing protein YvlB [Streptomyces sp. 2323.1]